MRTLARRNFAGFGPEYAMKAARRFVPFWHHHNNRPLFALLAEQLDSGRLAVVQHGCGAGIVATFEISRSGCCGTLYSWLLGSWLLWHWHLRLHGLLLWRRLLHLRLLWQGLLCGRLLRRRAIIIIFFRKASSGRRALLFFRKSGIWRRCASVRWGCRLHRSAKRPTPFAHNWRSCIRRRLGH